MAERGIIFSAPMVRALLYGRKTQTRRLLNPQPPTVEAVQALSGSGYHWFARKPTDREWSVAGPVWAVRQLTGEKLPKIKVPHVVGDRLYVREAWRTWKDYDHLPPSGMLGDEPIFLEADRDNCDRHGRLRPGMHMPRWASRLTLIVTDVRVERLQAITDEDARAEGCSGCLGPNPDFPDEWDPTPRKEFDQLWNTLHDKPGTTWADNPWIYAVTFQVVRANINEIPQGRSA